MSSPHIIHAADSTDHSGISVITDPCLKRLVPEGPVPIPVPTFHRALNVAMRPSTPGPLLTASRGGTRSAGCIAGPVCPSFPTRTGCRSMRATRSSRCASDKADVALVGRAEVVAIVALTTTIPIQIEVTIGGPRCPLYPRKQTWASISLEWTACWAGRT